MFLSSDTTATRTIDAVDTTDIPLTQLTLLTHSLTLEQKQGCAETIIVLCFLRSDTTATRAIDAVDTIDSFVDS